VPFWGLATAIGMGILLAIISAHAFEVFAWTTGALFVLGELLVLSFGLRRLADALRGEVHSVAGIVTREADSSGDGTTYRYKVNELKFQVSGRAYAALVSGMEYRIYYTPRSKTLVSIEPLGGAQV